MNHKQKFIYTALGAVIMLLGIGVGSIISPPLIAQRNGTFDEITCRELKVVNEKGKTAIHLGSNEEVNYIYLLDKAGNVAIRLGGDERDNSVSLWDKAGNVAIALVANNLKTFVRIEGANNSRPILLHSDNENNYVSIDGKGKGIYGGISLHTTEDRNEVSIDDPSGKNSFKFNAYVDRNELIVRDKSSGKGVGFYADSNEARQTTWNPPKE